MCPHTMAATTEQPVRPLDPLVQESSASNTVTNSCISRLSKWLWSSRSAPSASKNTKTIAFRKHFTSDEVGSPSGHSIETALPCRACQSWGVECDRQKPRCAHCLDQQILCFYVEPLRVTMKRSKKERSRTRLDLISAGSE